MLVAPRDRLTHELRAAIRGCKRELLDAMAEPTQDLETRIQAMAKRWDFSPDELTEELNRAAANPAAELEWVERDEHIYGDCKTPQDFAAAYSRIRDKT